MFWTWMLTIALSILRLGHADECHSMSIVEHQETRIKCECPGNGDIRHESTLGYLRRDITCSVYNVWSYGADTIGSCDNGGVNIDGDYKDIMTIEADESLLIYNTTTNNRGMYTCTRYSEVIPPQYTTRLSVEVPPKDMKVDVITDPILVGEDVTIQCVIARVDPPSDVTDVYWTVGDDDEIDAGDPDDDDDINDDGTYKLTYTTTVTFKREDNDQIFRCHAEWKEGDIYSSNSETLNVHYPPDTDEFTISSNMTDDTATEGTYIQFTCVIDESNPRDPDLILTQDGSELDEVQDMTLQHTMQLQRQDNMLEMQCCAGGDQVLWNETCTGTLQPNVTFTADDIKIDESALEKDESQEFSLECTTSESNPWPTEVRWKRIQGTEETELGSTTDTENGNYNAKITISTTTNTAQREDNQVAYRCEVVGQEETVYDDCILEVKFTVSNVSIVDKKDVVDESDVFSLTCETSESNPSPVKLLWTRDDTTLDSIPDTEGGCCNADKTTSTTDVITADRTHNMLTYRCEVDDEDLEEPLFDDNTIVVLFPVTNVSIVDKKDFVHEFNVFSLTCETSESNPSPVELLWTRDGTPVDSLPDMERGCCNANKTTSTTEVITANRTHNMVTYRCEMSGEDVEEHPLFDENTIEVFCEFYYFQCISSKVLDLVGNVLTSFH